MELRHRGLETGSRTQLRVGEEKRERKKNWGALAYIWEYVLK